MAQQKFYAVKVGRESGIFTTWDDCKKQVIGYKGAVYKSFLSREEAEQYLNGDKTIALEQYDGPIAYVDGSYDVNTGAFAAGAVILYQGEQIEFSEKYIDSELAQMRNVAGEIKASRLVMEYALANGWKNIAIYHDYQGISAWCDGSWQAKLNGTKEYRDFYQSIKDKLAVHFVKVKGHSGDKFNDIADSLAKKALGK